MRATSPIPPASTAAASTSIGVVNNYGHDSQAYCISVFGAENLTTANSVIRDNLCVDNNRSPRLARHHGGIHLTTWNGGKLDGVTITGNTIVWSPPVNAPLIRNAAAFTGSRPNIVENNTFIASMGELLESTGSLRFRQNRYMLRYGTPEWTENGRRFVGLGEWQMQAQDTGSTTEASVPDPLGGPFDPSQVPPRLRDAGIRLDALKGRYALIALLPDTPDARGLAVHLNSARFQYASKGLAVLAAVPGDPRQRQNLAADWALYGIEVVSLTAAAVVPLYRQTIPLPKRPRPLAANDDAPALYLLGPDCNLLRAWQGYHPAREILAPLRALLGPPAGVAAEPLTMAP